jgi:pyrroloquinoline-quinone synthase
LNGREFLKLEKDKLLNHPLFDDAFITTISSSVIFKRSKAKIFARLYYPHILRTRLYQASTLAITPDENIQFALSEILHDEYGSGNLENSHMEQYRKFMYALEFKKEEINAQEIIPELQMYISTMMRLTQGEDWLAAVAAVGIASEHSIPKYYDLLLKGLRKIPEIDDSNLELFIGHINLDVEHSKLIEDSILPYLDNKKHQARFSQGININMDSRKIFHSGLYREVFT